MICYTGVHHRSTSTPLAYRHMNAIDSCDIDYLLFIILQHRTHPACTSTQDWRGVCNAATLVTRRCQGLVYIKQTFVCQFVCHCGTQIGTQANLL